MKGIVKAVLLLMTILTVVYVSVVVYANSTSPTTTVASGRDVVYAARLYKSETPPGNWFTPDQLGIFDVTEYGSDDSCWLHIAVDRDKEPFPLQREQPIFLYKDRFFQVSPLWATATPPGISSLCQQILVGAVLAVGWIFTGTLFLKWRERK